MQTIDVGTKFRQLTVIEDLGMQLQKSGKKRHFVRCLCSCGNTKDINLADIKSGKILSCGCTHKKMVSELGKIMSEKRKGNPKHNLCKTNIYRKYHQAKGECYNPNNAKYLYFGGRNIKFCNEWIDENNGFLEFYDWSINNGYDEKTQKTSLCRKDLDGDFTPDNCFWETKEFAKKHCRSDVSSKAIYEKATIWRANNNDLFLGAITKGMKTRLKKYGTLVTNNRESCSWKQGWREIGGKRKYFRSQWEANYARYLEFLKQNNQIKEWQHENKTFWFDDIKRGCRSYLPDFEITNNDNSIEYHEVKGWYDDRSKTKIKRMAKYYPEVKLIIIFGKEYYKIANQMKRIIKDWE